MKQTPDVASTTPADRLFHVWLGRTTSGLSPAAIMVTYLDWVAHLAISPGKQGELIQKARRKGTRFALYAVKSIFGAASPPAIEPLPQDGRFQDERWQLPPFNLIYQSFLLYQQLWHNATTGIRGVSRRHEQTVSFACRQVLDIFSPANFLFTNPVVLESTIQQGGTNLVRGLMRFVEDQERALLGNKPVGTEKFQVGRDVAITSGKVVYRNRLIELIQYSPTTDRVWREPVLMVPTWTNKYYIMDLSPDNSMVKYLVENGHTVFMISWKNAGPEDRDLDMHDYYAMGVMDALGVACAIVPDTKVHTVGYCFGGIVLTIAAASMARDNDERLATVTLFATLTDFNQLGEMAVFIDPSEVSYLEDIMWEHGYLDPQHAAGMFDLLRSRDLSWSRTVQKYLRGKRQTMSDLMAWNVAGTRIPYRVHSQLLRRLILNNDLWDGRYKIGGRPIAISDIHVPIFMVSATGDHVAPWRSIYRFHLQTDAEEVTFVLATGGHNAAVLNPPGPGARDYQIGTSKAGDGYMDPDLWAAAAAKHDGSWWPAWEKWLTQRCTEQVPSPAMGNVDKRYIPLAAAPGTYVLED